MIKSDSAVVCGRCIQSHVVNLHARSGACSKMQIYWLNLTMLSRVNDKPGSENGQIK